MAVLTHPVLVILLLTNIMLLGSSSLRGCIKLVSVQGILLGIVPLLLADSFSSRVLIVAASGIVIKGMVFPALLSRALREANARREVEPLVGYTVSILFGVGALALAQWIAAGLPMPPGATNPLVLPLGLFMIQVGLFLIVTRRKALSQVLGYLVLENGIYLFGVGLSLSEHMLVELCVLLDVFVAVFVMGIIIFHINREFDHIDIDQLSDLKDWHE